MLFWLFFIVPVVCAGLYILIVELTGVDMIEIVALPIVASLIAILISLLVFGINYIGVDADIEVYNTRYESLKYQYENDMYDNDNDIGKYELIKSIQEWNEHLASKKRLQRDFWVGIYIPNIYDDFEFILLEK